MKFMLLSWFVVATLFAALKFVGAGVELDDYEKVLGFDARNHPVLTVLALLWVVSIVVAIIATFRFVIIM